MQNAIQEACTSLAQVVLDDWAQATQVSHTTDVSEAVLRAVTDPSSPMRIPAGEDAVTWFNALRGTTANGNRSVHGRRLFSGTLALTARSPACEQACPSPP